MLTRKLLSKQSMYFSLFQRPLLSVALAFQSSFPWPVLSAFLIALGPSKHNFPQIYRFYTLVFNLFNPSILGLVDIAITSSVPHWSQSLNQQIFLITPKSSLSFHPWPYFLYSPFLFLRIFFLWSHAGFVLGHQPWTRKIQWWNPWPETQLDLRVQWKPSS